MSEEGLDVTFAWAVLVGMVLSLVYARVAHFTDLTEAEFLVRFWYAYVGIFVFAAVLCLLEVAWKGRRD